MAEVACGTCRDTYSVEAGRDGAGQMTYDPCPDCTEPLLMTEATMVGVRRWLVAPDGDGEPTLWDYLNRPEDAPLAVLTRREVGEDAWRLILAGLDAERSEGDETSVLLVDGAQVRAETPAEPRRPTVDDLTEFLLARIAEDPRLDAEWREALRRIAEAADPEMAVPSGVVARHMWGQVVARTLAAVYADHPDYRQEWKP